MSFIHSTSHLRQHMFGENRTPNLLGIGKGFNAIKGAFSSATGGAKEAAEKASLGARIVGGIWKWAAMRDNPKALALRRLLPFWAIDKIGQAVDPYFDVVEDYTRAKVGHLAQATRSSVSAGLKRYGDVGMEVGKMGGHLVVEPAAEIAYGSTVRLGLRTLWNAPLTTISAAANVAGTPVRRTLDFGGQTVDYMKNIGGVRNSVTNVIDAFKAFKSSDYRGGIKNLLAAPFQPVIQAAKLAGKAAMIPVGTAGQAALGAAEVGTAMYRIMATPVETITNAYGHMAKAFDGPAKIRAMLGGEKGPRERISGILTSLKAPITIHKEFAYA